MVYSGDVIDLVALENISIAEYAACLSWAMADEVFPASFPSTR